MTVAAAGLRVVLVEVPVPLGRADMPAESHPILAPDAPGKDRMARPAPDPWRAPLGEALVFEAMKWRFLAHARTVLCLNPGDCLAARGDGTHEAGAPDPGPPEPLASQPLSPESCAAEPCAPTAFDLCAQAGAVTLTGRLAYPWRVRGGGEAHPGDHVCRTFDGGRGVASWGCAPASVGLDAVWPPRRAVKARASARIAFDRAMAIRVPGQPASALAPRTALVEDPALVARARAMGWKPVRPPASAPREAPAEAARAGRTAIVTTMKNEGPFILEWLAYHRAIGVDDFLVYTNDCTDGTDALLDTLQARGLVRHRENPYRESGLKPQHAALQAAESEPVMRECGWGICMDVDEFINIKVGDGTLRALHAAMGDANMIALTWRLFGNAEVHGYEDRFVTEQFTRCAPELIRKPHHAWGFKTLFRNIDIYRKLGVHRPKGLVPDLWDQVRWLNGSGRALPLGMLRNGWRSTVETYGYDWVQLNHYAARSVESFLVKRDRGRVNHVDRDQGLNYWFRMNHNVEEDRSIARMIPAARAEYDRLMADPEVAAAHARCVAAHRAKIGTLMATPEARAFHGTLTGRRMERLCRMQPHFGAAVFSAGPEVIPAGVEEMAVAKDWFFTLDPHAAAAEAASPAGAALADPAGAALADPAGSALAHLPEDTPAEAHEATLADPARASSADPAKAAPVNPARTALANPAKAQRVDPAKAAPADPAESSPAAATRITGAAVGG